MARRKARTDVHKIHEWDEKDLEIAAGAIITAALNPENSLDRTVSQITLSLILNEAYRRRELNA